MANSESLGEQNYKHFAHRYAQMVETKPHNAYYDRPAVLSLLPEIEDLHILDAGCGPGIYTEELLRRGAQATAIDVTMTFVALARARLGRRARVLHADLGKPLTFATDEEFDGVIAPLVLDYVEDWSAVFAEFHRILKVGGFFICSFSHPIPAWHIAQHFDQSENYFDVELYEMPWLGFGEPQPIIKSYRRSISDSINPLLRAGFRLDTILEPKPTDHFKQASPDDYKDLMRRPGFMCLRATK